MILTHSAPEYFEKLPLKNPATSNGCISKARANSESKLRFSESHSIFFKTGWFFAHSTHVGTQQSPVPLPASRGAQRFNKL